MVSKKRVVVAMSGGVDSSVAAFQFKQSGYEVTGAHMLLSGSGVANTGNIRDLEETCRILDIPLKVLDFQNEFNGCVIDYFCKEYARGYTPNPCVVCNKEIKFGRLLEWTLDNGAGYLATGHYARVEKDDSGFHLLKAVSLDNDQSYFLYRLGQDELKNILFPIGNIESKDEVRRIAKAAGLPVGDKPKSHDICFVPGGDYRSFIEKFVPPEPGGIVDRKGNVLGRHSGLANYTVGQREGLGISGKEPVYVLSLDVKNNRVIVGPREALYTSTLRLRDVKWISGKAPNSNNGLTCKIRYRAKEVAIGLELEDNTALVKFFEPQFAVTPGQSCVFYRGGGVLGGGVIAGTEDAGKKS